MHKRNKRAFWRGVKMSGLAILAGATFLGGYVLVGSYGKIRYNQGVDDTVLKFQEFLRENAVPCVKA